MAAHYRFFRGEGESNHLINVVGSRYESRVRSNGSDSFPVARMGRNIVLKSLDHYNWQFFLKTNSSIARVHSQGGMQFEVQGVT